MPSRVIGLITDFGLRDWFVGVMKGVILSINPSAVIVDLTDEVPSHDIACGSFAIIASYRFLPLESIIVGVVDPGVGSKRAVICARAGNRYFIAPDNGMLGPLFEREPPEQVVEVTNEEYFLKPVSTTFHGRDIFAPVAAHLSLGIEMSRLGKPIDDYQRMSLREAHFDGEVLRVDVMWVDHFGNLVTNCCERLLGKVVETLGRKLFISESRLPLRIVDFYEAGKEGELIGILGSTGNLEISTNLGRAADLLGAGAGTSLHIIKAKWHS